MTARQRRAAALVGGAVLGASFFLWIAGTQIIDPTETGWVMQLDWRVHFLGWHFFRSEPWQWPPGRIIGYYHAPDGTAVGFTDSIPLAAFLLKPVASWLPMPFQYLGAWLLVCFTLQGLFGVLLMRRWTSGAVRQLLGAALFVLMPTLLVRVGHPSLCAHWLLLWAIWLYLRGGEDGSRRLAEHAALGLAAGLVHPYLAVMVLALVVARAWLVKSAWGAAAGLAAVLTGWWLSGLFTVTNTVALAEEGLGDFSMNLLGPITPAGWSTLLPEPPLGAPGQGFEGNQYLGAGTLALGVMALGLAVWHVRRLPWSRMAPLLVVCIACAVYALSPRVTLGDAVVFDLTGAAVEQRAIFRVTGRFFWPFAYVLVISAVAIVLTRLPRRSSLVLLSLAVALQLVDLRDMHATLRRTSRNPSLHGQQLPLTSPIWTIALPHYRHMVVLPPQQCGPAPTTFEWPAYLAGLYGLTINAGEVARPDPVPWEEYCRSVGELMSSADLRDDSIYLVQAALVPVLTERAPRPIVCTELNAIPVCITAASFETWRHEVP